MVLAVVKAITKEMVPMKDRDYEIKALDITDEVKKPDDADIEAKESEADDE